jgi:23S rRNA pseudouridine1911/1915/1917 synthase
MKEIIFKALEENFKQRLDKFLVARLTETNPEFSRSRIQILITSGNVFNDQTVITNCDYKIKGDETFLIKIPEAKESQVLAKEIPFEVVFEDENMLVVNKPAGLTTHPGAGNQDHTLVNALLFALTKTLPD